MRRGELHRVDRIRRIGATNDGRGMPIEGAVPDAARLFVARIAVEQQRAVQTRAKFCDLGARKQQLLARPREDGQIVGGRGLRAD